MVFYYEKWIDSLKMYDSSEQYSELLILYQYIFAILAHNANVERIFSHMHIQ